MYKITMTFNPNPAYPDDDFDSAQENAWLLLRSIYVDKLSAAMKLLVDKNKTNLVLHKALSEHREWDEQVSKDWSDSFTFERIASPALTGRKNGTNAENDG